MRHVIDHRIVRISTVVETSFNVTALLEAALRENSPNAAAEHLKHTLYQRREDSTQVEGLHLNGCPECQGPTRMLDGCETCVDCGWGRCAL